MTDKTPSAPPGENIPVWTRISRLYDFWTDRVAWFYKDFVRRIADEVGPDERVLDLATGTGVVPLALGEKVKSIIATDLTEAMVEKARAKAHARGLDHIRFETQSAYDLPYEEGAYDVVVIANGLHVMKEPERALREIHRVLRPGGRLFAPTFCHGDNRPVAFASWLAEFSGVRIYGKFTVEEFTALVERYGFTVTETDRYGGWLALIWLVAERR